jgi:hypothetical protein
MVTLHYQPNHQWRVVVWENVKYIKEAAENKICNEQN